MNTELQKIINKVNMGLVVSALSDVKIVSANYMDKALMVLTVMHNTTDDTYGVASSYKSVDGADKNTLTWLPIYGINPFIAMSVIRFAADCSFPTNLITFFIDGKQVETLYFDLIQLDKDVRQKEIIIYDVIENIVKSKDFDISEKHAAYMDAIIPIVSLLNNSSQEEQIEDDEDEEYEEVD